MNTTLQNAVERYVELWRKQRAAVIKLDQTEVDVVALAMNIRIDECEDEMNAIAKSMQTAGTWSEFQIEVNRQTAIDTVDRLFINSTRSPANAE